MKVLFICSGNNKFGISPIVFNQGESLKHQGIDIDYFTIKGKGTFGYIKNIPKIKAKIKSENYDLIHAHYSLTAFATTLSFPNKPIIVSLMGSDVKSKKYTKVIIKLFRKYFWQQIIVKSNNMKNMLGINDTKVIPNGVNFKRFKPINRRDALKFIGWGAEKSHILFAANPKRIEKNFSLAKKAFNLLNNKNIDLHYLNDIPNENLPYYFNSANVILLTSLWEGSPNVIKEAMACNCPIVSTDVGDVKEVIGNTEGCYITSYDPEDVAERIKMALDFGKRTNGRQRILELGLDSVTIAKKIIKVYKQVLNEK
ncbi:MAG: glycosyltransferase family 4 protein [Candidatus Helarchaeota archaeon]